MQSQILRCLSYHQSPKPPKDRYWSSLISKILPVYSNFFIWALFLTSIFLTLKHSVKSSRRCSDYFNLYLCKAPHDKIVTDYFKVFCTVVDEYSPLSRCIFFFVGICDVSSLCFLYYRRTNALFYYYENLQNIKYPNPLFSFK